MVLDAELDALAPDVPTPDAAPPDSATTDALGLDAGVPDAAADLASGGLCADVVCEPNEDCVEGACVPRPPERGPAAGCTGARDCPGGVCEVDPGLPGGFCRVDCGDDDDCGPGAACDAGRCLQRCGERRPCREGWTCLSTLRDELDLCRPDCRVVGCAEAACNEGTGACESCRYPCAEGEVCTNGNCVRRDETCVTGYHCVPAEEQCARGRCVPRVDPPCVADLDCPVDEVCAEGVCAEVTCELGAPCDVGGQPGWCLQLDDPAEPVCVVAGEVAGGAACDEATERCEAGFLCFGDPDDPEDPEPPAGRGVCRAVCGACAADTCVQLGERGLGLCLPSDCSVLADDCGEGAHCRPYGLLSDAGACGPAGDLVDGCHEHADCAAHAICVGAAEGTTCLSLCDPDAAACPADERCLTDDTWAFGICR